MPTSDSASRTSSSLNGLMMASIFFMVCPSRFGFLKFVLITVGNRIAPILAKATRRDANTDRRLATLVFGNTQQANDTAYGIFRQAAGDDLARTAILFHIGADDRIQHFVGRQRILVGLVRLQFGGRRPNDDVF